MSDELHKYPGNLKHHKLVPDDPYLVELRKAIEPMEREMDTAKQFLLFAGERDALLAARAKDAELIQRLVDALRDTIPAEYPDHWSGVLSDAAAAGFKPSER